MVLKPAEFPSAQDNEHCPPSATCCSSTINRCSSSVDLLHGWPSPSLLPIERLRTAAQHVFSHPHVAVSGMSYGPEPGFAPLRAALGRWLGNFYGHAVIRAAEQHQRTWPTTWRFPSREARTEGFEISANRIAITGGASQNLGCLLSVFTDPSYTQTVWMTAPAYYLAFKIFEDAGFSGRLRAVPEDDGGIDVEWLRQELQRCDEGETMAGMHRREQPIHAPICLLTVLVALDQKRLKPSDRYPKIYKHIVYTVPSFSNPSSKTMSCARREELVRIARHYDALIICDDVYDMLQWPEEGHSAKKALTESILPRVVDIDRYLEGGVERPKADGFGNVVSNGSFSKICAPGCRAGWAEGSPKLAHELSETGTTRSGGAPSQLTSTFMADLLDSGELQDHVFGTLQPAYARRYGSMKAEIERSLVPLGVMVPQWKREVAGGYFIWLRLPRPLLGAEVARRAQEEEKVTVARGELFEVPGGGGQGRFRHEVRVCFAWASEEEVVEGIKRLGRVIERMQGEQG